MASHKASGKKPVGMEKRLRDEAIEKHPNRTWRKFSMMELREAVAWALGGGIAVHVMPSSAVPDNAPACFLAAKAEGRNFAHLLGPDWYTLTLAANFLRLKSAWIQYDGKIDDGRHIYTHFDLVGFPLERALKLCEKPEMPVVYERAKPGDKARRAAQRELAFKGNDEGPLERDEEE